MLVRLIVMCTSQCQHMLLMVLVLVLVLVLTLQVIQKAFMLRY